MGGDDKPDDMPSDSEPDEASEGADSVLLPPEADAIEKGLKPSDGDGAELRESD